MTLIVGAPLRLDERLRIGAFILTPERSLEVYTKRHLGAFPPAAARDGTIPPAEETVFVAGDANPLVHVGDARAAVAICADTGHASHALAAAERGARLYLASTFVIPSDFANVSETLAQRAREHALTVVFANFGGPSGGLAAAGRSAIRSATGELVVQLPAGGAGIATATRTGTDWRGSARML